MAWSLAKSIHRDVHSVNSMMDLCVVFSSEPSLTRSSSPWCHIQCARARTGVNRKLFASSSGSIHIPHHRVHTLMRVSIRSCMPIVRKYMGVFYQSPKDHHPWWLMILLDQIQAKGVSRVVGDVFMFMWTFLSCPSSRLNELWTVLGQRERSGLYHCYSVAGLGPALPAWMV